MGSTSDVAPFMAEQMLTRFPGSGKRWSDELRAIKDDKKLTQAQHNEKFPNASRAWSVEDVSIDTFLSSL